MWKERKHPWSIAKGKQTRRLVKGDHIFRLDDLFGWFIGLLGNYCSKSFVPVFYLYILKQIEWRLLVFYWIRHMYLCIYFIVLINLFRLLCRRKGVGHQSYAHPLLLPSIYSLKYIILMIVIISMYITV